jgi:hypothetical protein
MPRAAVPMSDARFDDVALAVMESYPNACVLWVDAIDADALRSRYDARLARALSDEATPGRETQRLRLFHGTGKDNVGDIARHGFSSAANVRAAYGRGTYLATTARMSQAYSPPDGDGVSYMFVCRAIVGVSALGRGKPAVDAGFDSAVDDLASPSLYVVPFDDAILPEFVVAFHAGG